MKRAPASLLAGIQVSTAKGDCLELAFRAVADGPQQAKPPEVIKVSRYNKAERSQHLCLVYLCLCFCFDCTLSFACQHANNCRGLRSQSLRIMTLITGSRGPAVIATCATFTVLAAISVGLRLIARIHFLKNGGLDEVAIVFCLLCSIIQLVATIYEVKHGVGNHFHLVTPENATKVLKGLFAAILSYNLGLGITKVSIVLQYLRVFIGPRIHKACWATIVFISIYVVQCSFTTLFICVPVHGFWTGVGRCVDRQALWFFHAAFNIILDVVIICLPMPVISSLKLPRKQKLGLMFIFACGGFVCIVSILRLRALYKASVSHDFTWDNAETAIWSDVELNMGIICASLPTIKPVIGYLFPHLLSSTSARSSPGYAVHGTSRSVQLKELDTSNVVVDRDRIVRTHDGETTTRVEGGKARLGSRDLEMGFERGYGLRSTPGPARGNSAVGGEDRDKIHVKTSLRQFVDVEETGTKMDTDRDSVEYLIIQR